LVAGAQLLGGGAALEAVPVGGAQHARVVVDVPARRGGEGEGEDEEQRDQQG